MNPGSRKLLLLFLFLAVNISALKAQDQFLLKEFLSILENRHQVTFLYDSDLLERIKIQTDTSVSGLNYAVKELNEKTAFTFQETEPGVFSVKPVVAGANLKICGRVLDKATGEAVPGAVLFTKDGTAAATTGPDGAFSFYADIRSSDSLTVYSFSYDPLKLSLEEMNGQPCMPFNLKPAVQALGMVVLTSYMTEGINYDLEDNKIVIKPNGLSFLAGETDADILLALDALPGISTPNSKAGNLNIRGSSPDQTLILFDNIPIYHKGHYFGTLSSYNPSVVDEVNVLRSAYLADKGGRVGGAIELHSRKNVPDSAIFGASISTLTLSGFTHVPVVKDKVGLLVGIRSSYPPSWISPKLKAIQDFIYQESEIFKVEKSPDEDFDSKQYSFNDLNAKLIMKPGKKDRASISFLNIHNNVLFEITDRKKNYFIYDKILLSNWGYNVEWVRNHSEKFYTHVTGTHSSYKQSFISKTDFLPDSVLEDAFFENRIEDVKLNLTSHAEISEIASLNFGYNLQYHDQLYRNNSFLSGAPPVTHLNKKTAFLHSVFGNYKLGGPSKKYIFTAGLRLNYYTLTRRFYPEPRLMATYFINKALSLKASAGLYNQYLMQISGISVRSIGGIDNLLWLLADGESIPVVSSRQFMLGGIFQKNSWVIDLESYYKLIGDISINNIANFKSPNRYIYGSGKTIGIDLLLKKSMKNTDAWISYSLSKTEMHFDSVSSDPFPGVWDQTHVLDVVFAWKWKRFKVCTGWKLRSGLYALNGIRTKYLAGPPLVPVGTPPPPPPGGTHLPGSVYRYSDQYPVYHQADLSIVYSFPKGKKEWNGTIGLSVLNLYDQKNIIEQVPRPLPQGFLLVNKYAMGFAPNLTATINW